MDISVIENTAIEESVYDHRLAFKIVVVIASILNSELKKQLLEKAQKYLIFKNQVIITLAFSTVVLQ